MRLPAQLTPHGSVVLSMHAHDEHLGEMRQTMLDAVTVRSRISPICRSSCVYHSTMLRSACMVFIALRAWRLSAASYYIKPRLSNCVFCLHKNMQYAQFPDKRYQYFVVFLHS